MNPVKEKLVEVCIIVTVTIAMLLGLEIAARVAIQAKARYFPPPDPPSTILKQAWGRQYKSDEVGLSFRHLSYVEFGLNPYRSATINVDEDGRRLVRGNCEKSGAHVVWIFGGSTMFGDGVPDEFTIPSYLAGLFNREGRCAKIVNFGTPSWQSSQSLIQLMESLKRGQRPQEVIFYDGINDSYDVVYGGRPGEIDPSAEVRLDRLVRGPQIHEVIAANSELVRIVSTRIFGMQRVAGVDAHVAVTTNVPARAKAMASIYAQNVRIVGALAKEYGFSAHYFLQPFPLIGRKKLTPMEEALMTQSGILATDISLLRTFYGAFPQEPELKANPRYFDISALFDGLTEELFTDEVHLLPEGNRIVAERIAGAIALPPVATSH